MKRINTLSELKESEKNARRNIIIDAAEKEFTSKPFNKVTMRDIARRAGISPALIYRHFPDQQSLFVEAYLRGISGMFNRIFKKIDESKDGAIGDVMDDFIDFFTRNDQYYRMMMNFFLDGSVDRDLFDKLNVLERGMLDNFDTMFIKLNIKDNVRFHSHTLFAALIGIIATFRNHPLKNDAEVLKHRKRIAANLARIFTEFAPHRQQ
jgi:AcrR family transcriptional regulator